MGRQASLLGSSEWLDAAKSCFHTDAEQQFCSFGLRLSNLVQDFDVMLKSGYSQTRGTNRLLKDMEDLVQSMVNWHQGCNCLQHQHFIGPQVAFPTRSMQPIRFQNIEVKKRLSRCISIRAMQLVCRVLVSTLRVQTNSTQADGHLDDGDTFAATGLARLQGLGKEIIKLSNAFGNSTRSIGHMSRIVWSLSLVRHGNILSHADQAACDVLIERFIGTTTPVYKKHRYVKNPSMISVIINKLSRRRHIQNIPSIGGLNGISDSYPTPLMLSCMYLEQAELAARLCPNMLGSRD